AVIVTTVLAETVPVLIVKAAPCAPAGTVTRVTPVPKLATLELLLASATEMPPVGARLLRSTVPFSDLPATQVLTESVSDVRVHAFTVSLAVFETTASPEPLEAVSVTAVSLEIRPVVKVKVLVVWPAATVTGVRPETGAALSLVVARVMLKPPVGAALPIVRVPVTLSPPDTLVALSLEVERAG